MKTKEWLHLGAFTLALIGALNWGLVGLLNMNLVEWVFGMSPVSQLVYVLIGLSAVYIVFTHKESCEVCMKLMKKGKRR